MMNDQQKFLKDAADGTLTSVPELTTWAGPTVREIPYMTRQNIGRELVLANLIKQDAPCPGSNAFVFVLTDAGCEARSH